MLVPYVIVPPAAFLWLGVLGGLIGMRRPTGRMLITVGLLGLFLSSLPVVSDALLGALTVPKLDPKPGTPGAIIVLGGDGRLIQDSALSAGEPVGQVGALSLERVAGTARLARATGAPVLTSGGAVGNGQPAIAGLMADALADYGFDARWREERSTDTCENARYSAEILRQAGIEKAWVVTHAWHMRRAVLAFARAGFEIVPAPLPPDGVHPRDLTDFLPHASSWNRFYWAAHEWIGLVAYRFGACPVAPAEQP